jgi:hypothetical protein
VSIRRILLDPRAAARRRNPAVSFSIIGIASQFTSGRSGGGAAHRF